jgi:Ca2+-binding RTX toxin-like protein
LLDNRKRDKLQGAKNLNNLLVGLEGDDELTGNVGDDYFIGGTGNDIINGGKGFDRAVYHLNREAYIITEDGQRATVKKNPDYEQHTVTINLFHWNNTGLTNTMNLSINGDEVLARQTLKVGNNSFTITKNEIINSIEYQHAQKSKSDGTAISLLKIDDVEINLGKAIFLDNKEEWMGVDIHDNLGTGSARVKFGVAELNKKNKDEGVDKLLDIEELRFLDQSYLLKQVKQSTGLNFIAGTSGKDKLKGKKSSVHLKGMGGNDKLIGSRKDDILDGGYGNDVLIGKKGADTYVLSPGEDKFNRFKLKEGDTIEIASDVTYTLLQFKKNILIQHDDGVTTVIKVNKDDLASIIDIV